MYDLDGNSALLLNSNDMSEERLLQFNPRWKDSLRCDLFSSLNVSTRSLGVFGLQRKRGARGLNSGDVLCYVEMATSAAARFSPCDDEMYRSRSSEYE